MPSSAFHESVRKNKRNLWQLLPKKCDLSRRSTMLMDSWMDLKMRRQQRRDKDSALKVQKLGSQK